MHIRSQPKYNNISNEHQNFVIIPLIIWIITDSVTAVTQSVGFLGFHCQGFQRDSRSTRGWKFGHEAGLITETAAGNDYKQPS